MINWITIIKLFKVLLWTLEECCFTIGRWITLLLLSTELRDDGGGRFRWLTLTLCGCIEFRSIEFGCIEIRSIQFSLFLLYTNMVYTNILPLTDLDLERSEWGLKWLLGYRRLILGLKVIPYSYYIWTAS